MIKGGIWRNTEDEILKAAVMKYGKNQWSRIASLLHRKSAKQCKARWFEWLDPSIKKTEWNRQEEEKLLHLAKLMPTQWRTISSIVGRTASQCLEHYDLLLDQASKQKEEGEGEGQGQGHDLDPRKLKPGDIDPNPETKPARPDPKDMDEDELEMLSEARARLANTQGKKAKRKAREKQLEEARRLASLQKRRELRMAGILTNNSGQKRKMKKKGLIDYNQEIPFKKSVPAGLYDVSQEIFQPPEHDFKKLRQSDVDKGRREGKEEKERVKDKKALDHRKDHDPQSLLSLMDPGERFGAKKRSKLVLPSPQITDIELDSVVKMGKSSSSSIALNDDDLMTSNDYYSITSKAVQMIRTPKSSINSKESILMEAQNLISLTNVETPLKGGLNTPFIDMAFAGAGSGGMTPGKTPSASSLGSTPITPNPLVSTPFRTLMTSSNNDSLLLIQPDSVRSNHSIASSSSSTTIQSSSSPLISSFVRDQMMINPEESLVRKTFDSLQEEKIFKKEFKEDLKKSFSGLPIPKNEYEIVLEEEETTTAAANDDVIIQDDDLDQSELDLKREEEEKKRIEEEWKKQSKSVQRNLPRPSLIPINSFLKGNNNNTSSNQQQQQLTKLQEAEEVIKKEMISLLSFDCIKNPSMSQLIRLGSQSGSSNMKDLQSIIQSRSKNELTQEELFDANQLLEEEMNLLRDQMDHHQDISSFSNVWGRML